MVGGIGTLGPGVGMGYRGSWVTMGGEGRESEWKLETEMGKSGWVLGLGGKYWECVRGWRGIDRGDGYTRTRGRYD